MTEFSTIPLSQIRCGYFPLCSGCEIQDEVVHPPIIQVVTNYFKSIDPSLEIPLHYKEIIGWRSRSKLAVRGSYQHPEIGLFKKGSHEVVPIPDCPLHHLAINKAYTVVRQLMIEMKIPAYDEEKGTGLIRYLQFVVERKSRRVQLTITINRQGKDPLIERFIKQLYKESMFLGIWVNYQSESINRIFGPSWELVAGEPYLWESLCGINFALHPACFAQAHLSLFEDILKKIQECILPNKTVVEIYAGIGMIGLSVAHKVKKLICSEINPYAEECFHLTRLQLKPELQKKVSFLCASADKCLHLIDEAEVIIVDPPRKGVDPHLLHHILHSSTCTQLIYLSCGFLSFQKDCDQLLKAGWKIEKAEAYLLFPGTNHVETLCIFKR